MLAVDVIVWCLTFCMCVLFVGLLSASCFLLTCVDSLFVICSLSSVWLLVVCCCCLLLVVVACCLLLVVCSLSSVWLLVFVCVCLFFVVCV